MPRRNFDVNFEPDPPNYLNSLGGRPRIYGAPDPRWDYLFGEPESTNVEDRSNTPMPNSERARLAFRHDIALGPFMRQDDPWKAFKQVLTNDFPPRTEFPKLQTMIATGLADEMGHNDMGEYGLTPRQIRELDRGNNIESVGPGGTFRMKDKDLPISDNIEDERINPGQYERRLKRLDAIQEQANNADLRSGYEFPDYLDPYTPPLEKGTIQTFMGKENPVDPFSTNPVNPTSFLQRLGPFATPELGMMILQNPEKAVEMLAGRGIPLMHSDFGTNPAEFPPSPSYPSVTPNPKPANMGAGNAPPMPSIPKPAASEAPTSRYDPTDPFAPTEFQQTQMVPGQPPAMGGQPQVEPPGPAPTPASMPAPTPAPTPMPGSPVPSPQPNGGGFWNNVDQMISGTLRQFIPGGDKLDPNKPALAQPMPPAAGGWLDPFTLWQERQAKANAQNDPYKGMDPQDYNTPAPAPVPYGGMDPEDYNTPGPSPFDPVGEPMDITSAAQKGQVPKPGANGLAQALAGLKAVEPGKGNIPGTPPPPHPTNGNNLGDLVQLITAQGKGPAGPPLDTLGLLLSKGRL